MKGRSYIPLLFASLGLAVCGCGQEQERAGDTGEVPECAEGYLADGGRCVPESCGPGSWGSLEGDDTTVYVDIDAPEGGDGGEGAPLRSIQSALDLAGSRGGGLVAVAAGSYPETLTMTSDHTGVHLAGRCRELVTLDASAGQGHTPGVLIASLNSEVELSGLSVVGASYIGIVVASGVVRMSELEVSESASVGLAIYRDNWAATSVQIEGCSLVGNTGMGLMAFEPGTEVTVLDSAILGTRPLPGGGAGYGIQAYEGAHVTVHGCELGGNADVGVTASHSGTEVVLVDTIIRDTQPDGQGTRGFGVAVIEGAAMQVERCELVHNADTALVAHDPGTEVTLVDTTIRDTSPLDNGDGGSGIAVYDGARLHATGCELVGNTVYGLVAYDPATAARLVDTVIRDTLPLQDSAQGFGLQVHSGAALEAEGCELVGNVMTGIAVADPGTNVTLLDTTVAGTLPVGRGEGGDGIAVSDSATLSAMGCVLTGNADIGLLVAGAGTEVTLVDTEIRDTQPDGDGEHGFGLQVESGAVLFAEGCAFEGNSAQGLLLTGAGTRATLSDTAIRDTWSTGSGEGGYGVGLTDGAALHAESCVVEGNTWAGVLGYGAGTEVSLLDTTIQGTLPSTTGEGGFGIDVHTGAALLAKACEVVGSTKIGVAVVGAGTHATLLDTSVRDTSLGADGVFGVGIQVHQGASLSVDGCVLDGNYMAGILAAEAGTGLELVDSSISGTKLSPGNNGTTALGIIAQQGASVSATGMLIRDNDGPGLYAVNQDSLISCTDCRLLDNRFAGVGALDGATLDIHSSSITGTSESANLGGGVGIYLAEYSGLEAPTLILEDSVVADNPAAGAWLSGAGVFRLAGNTISGGQGVPHGAGVRCGDGVYSRDVLAWDDASGLMLEGNTISDNAGAGLFLDDAAAMLDGNSWSGNAPDLLVQGEACLSPRADYEDAPEAEVCPQWNRPACDLDFSLTLTVVDVVPSLPPPPRLRQMAPAERHTARLRRP